MSTPNRLSARNERLKKEWEDSLDVLLGRVSALETLDSNDQLFKKWGIAGYLRVSMNEGDVKDLGERLVGLDRQNENLRAQLEVGKLPPSLFTEDERKQLKDTLNGITSRIENLKKATEAQLKNLDKSEETRKKEETAAKKLADYKKQLEENRGKVDKRSEEILAEIQGKREKEYEDRYKSGVLNVMRAKAEFDPLGDDEAQRLQRKQAVFDEIRLQQQLAKEGVTTLSDPTAAGILSLIKEGAIAGKRYGSALIQGASELASELFWTSINTTMIFFTWPLALPVKGINHWVLRPLSKALNGASGGLDETILKGAIPAWGKFVTDFPKGGVGTNIARVGAAIFGAPFALAGAGVSYAAKGLAYGAEKLYKNFNWDNMMRTPGGLVAGGLLGGGVGIAITIALLVAAPFTFGITAGILAGLWIGIGASAAIGVAKGIKNAKDAGKAEINLELSEEESNRLMEWEHRHGSHERAAQAKQSQDKKLVQEQTDKKGLGEDLSTQRKSEPIGQQFGKTVDELTAEKEKHSKKADGLGTGSDEARPSITISADQRIGAAVHDVKDSKERDEVDKDKGASPKAS